MSRPRHWDRPHASKASDRDHRLNCVAGLTKRPPRRRLHGISCLTNLVEQSGKHSALAKGKSMTWDLNDQEFQSAIRLPPAKRYSYFLKKVVDWKSVWSLANSAGWVLARDNSGGIFIPVWPHERFATACAVAMWEGHESRSIDLAIWIDRWLPGMQRDGKTVGVFPTPSGLGISTAPGQLLVDLRIELSQYEDDGEG